MTRNVLIFLALMLALSSAARADVWRWVDAEGNTHYVDSNRAIWTWSDEQGKSFYSDKPDHENAIRVQLVWHSSGSLDDVASSGASADEPAYPGETADERAQREAVVAHNCQRATEILESYENAPALYRTDENGKRHVLTEKEYAAELADAKEKTRFLCSQ